MNAPRPVIAVVPFGARAASRRAGARARQLARRLVDRFARDLALELRPVFLMTMPDTKTDASYLVFGSSPDAELAASYGASLGASHALSGTFFDAADGRRLEVSLVDVARRAAIASRTFAVAPGELQQVEPAVASWLVAQLGVISPAGLAPVAANETAYAALLEGMDEEVNETLLRQSDPDAANAALVRALQRHVDALRADAECIAAEERLLYLAAASLEHGNVDDHVRALEELTTLRPQSWRAHYMLGQLRAEVGDSTGAIVAFEHAHALRALPPADVIRLAKLYAKSGAPASALAHLRRVDQGAGELPATARRLRFGIAHPELERDLERAGTIVASGDAMHLDEAEATFRRSVDAEPDLWEAHFGLGLVARHRGDTATAETALRRVLEIWPEQPDALHELGVALLLANQTDEAVRSLALAASLRPRDAGYLADAGFALLRAGDLAAARERLEHARDLDATDPITRSYLDELDRVESSAGKT